MKNYYQILELSKTASVAEIKKAYRKLALKWHPDRNKLPAAEEKFIEITEAYDILSDPQKKTRYDAILSGSKKSYYTKTTNTRKTRSSYDEWMEFQAQKARQQASKKAHMNYNKYKRQQFGGGLQTKSSFLSAITIMGILFLITILIVYFENQKIPKHERPDISKELIGAFATISFLLIIAWLVLKFSILRKRD